MAKMPTKNKGMLTNFSLTEIAILKALQSRNVCYFSKKLTTTL
jgi:hypothetical protein